MSKQIFNEVKPGNGFFEHYSCDSVNNEYFFSSTRKGYNYFGLILRIVRNRLPSKQEKRNIIFKDSNLSISVQKSNGKNIEDFIDHIYILKIENYFYEFIDLEDSTYVYSGIEVIIFTNFLPRTEKIGKYVTEECENILRKQFVNIRYWGHEYFALFCALEGITKIPSLDKYQCLEFLSSLPYGEKACTELNDFSKGIEVEDFFSDYPFKILDEKDSFLLIDALHKPVDTEVILDHITKDYSVKPIQDFLVKIPNFNNVNRWILLKVGEGATISGVEDALQYLQTHFKLEV